MEKVRTAGKHVASCKCQRLLYYHAAAVRMCACLKLRRIMLVTTLRGTILNTAPIGDFHRQMIMIGGIFCQKAPRKSAAPDPPLTPSPTLLRRLLQLQR